MPKQWRLWFIYFLLNTFLWPFTNVLLTIHFIHYLTFYNSTLSFFIFRSSSVVCNVQSSHQGPDSIPSLPGLACPGWRDRPGLVVPSSPFPLLSGLGLLLKTIMGIHKGLICKVWYILYMDGLDYSRWIITGLGALLDVVFFCHLVAAWTKSLYFNPVFLLCLTFSSTVQFPGLLLTEPVIGYLRGCSQATPTLSHTRAWLLRHEHLVLYLLLELAHRLVGSYLNQTHIDTLLFPSLCGFRSHLQYINITKLCFFHVANLIFTICSFLLFSGSHWPRSSETCFTIPPGGAGSAAVVTTWQWIPGTWAALHHHL